MSNVKMALRSGPSATSVSVEIRNTSSELIIVHAPNPYRCAWIVGDKGEPYTRIRAVKSTHFPKIAHIRPGEAVLATIDLLEYFDEVQGEVLVQVIFTLINDSGQSQEQAVQGKALLNIPSFEKKLEEWKRRPRRRGGPMKLFDASSSTQFQALS